MAKLYLMMGAPGSGKTTWAKEFKKDEDRYISRDAIRFNMLKPGDAYFSKEKQVYKEFIRQVDAAIAKTKGIVYADATHLNSASRLKLLNALDNRPEEVCVVYLQVPLKVALERNAQRKGRARVPEDSIKNMYNSIEFPALEEGISGVFIIGEKGYLTDYVNLKEGRTNKI